MNVLAISKKKRFIRLGVELFSAVAITVGISLAIGLLWRQWQWNRQAESQFNSSVAVSSQNTNFVQPVSVSLPAIFVNAPLVPLGLNSDRTVELPTRGGDVGWYKNGAVPGNAGTAVLIGHLDTTIGPAVFWNLKNMKIGDTVSIHRNDGSTAVFSVSAVHQYSQDNFPDQQIYTASATPTLQLITCSGFYSRTEHHYSNNLVVSASLEQMISPFRK